MAAAVMQNITWSDSSVHLKDLAGTQLPVVAKVIKGQYRNIGVSKSVFNELYIHSIRQSQKVMCEGIKLKDGKKIQKTDQTFSLPVTYQGWFEVLSAEGKAIKALESVRQLLKVFPTHCLVRANTKAIIENLDGDLTGERTRVVHTGEQLKLIGDMNVPLRTSKGGVSKKRVLRCTDETGNNLYFLTDQKGLFSPIAGQDNISGVHNIKGLLQKFRFPISVRLVHGIIPTRLDKPSFAGIFRLISIYNDETAFVCPLKRDVKMVPVSTQEPLKLAVATNFDDIKDSDQIQMVDEKCSSMIRSYMNSIHILINNPPAALSKSRGIVDDPQKMSASKVKHKSSLSPPATLTMPPESTGERVIAKVEEDILFEEVDDIYQYVRQGGAPPPDRPRPKELFAEKKKKGKRGHLSPQNDRPAPAPVAEAVFASPGKHTEDDYWEEPIYEQLDKYLKKSQEADHLIAIGTKVAVRTGNNNGSQEILNLVPAESKQTLSSNSTATSGSLSRGSTSELPPVPTKQFDSGFSDSLDEKSSPVQTQQKLPKREVHTPDSDASKKAQASVPEKQAPSKVEGMPEKRALPTEDVYTAPKRQVKSNTKSAAPKPPLKSASAVENKQKRNPPPVTGEKPRAIISPSINSSPQNKPLTPAPTKPGEEKKQGLPVGTKQSIVIPASSIPKPLMVQSTPVVVQVGDTRQISTAAVPPTQRSLSVPSAQSSSVSSGGGSDNGEVKVTVITKQLDGAPPPHHHHHRQLVPSTHIHNSTTIQVVSSRDPVVTLSPSGAASVHPSAGVNRVSVNNPVTSAGPNYNTHAPPPHHAGAGGAGVRGQHKYVAVARVEEDDRSPQQKYGVMQKHTGVNQRNGVGHTKRMQSVPF